MLGFLLILNIDAFTESLQQYVNFYELHPAIKRNVK